MPSRSFGLRKAGVGHVTDQGVSELHPVTVGLALQQTAIHEHVQGGADNRRIAMPRSPPDGLESWHRGL